ncbi:BZ3500_MvSof-1268-A1-R1_Chr7-1g09379 [Microbotryum saponariae]|uniref:BZ3500_MvSof-1268-A1-R1_Chr7-1g09379 protein n=1 Tax=Microbotryum saponariae TaxID=289078 RepID=A0A2X0LEK7_9BASI|nr:BZ3501_MvSof-1269-A2-R1_Chr7-1g09084 [Microbotryum saponariae]SDA03328.1 BZ3500_MvSof-1268-A1-R1_Chr7-1g09379 [Microbotryum saponariae]
MNTNGEYMINGLVWAWGRISPRHGPAKKPAGQRKQGEANRGGGRESKKI